MITLPKGTIIDSIHILDSVGSGGSGQVYVGQDEINKQFYAVKSINTTDRGAIRLEAGLHSRVKEHPNVVNLERIIRTTDGATHFVLEYSPEGDLYSAITERDLYCGDHTLIRNTFLQLIDAVSYCHERGVYHRDLKPDNILVFDHGKTIKLADFGLATTDIVSQDYGCGSTIYFSPECQGGLTRSTRPRPYATAPNDIWALGIILINLTTGRNPWKQACLDDENFRAFLFDPEEFLLNLLLISSELNSILKRIFCVDPAHRISLPELRQRILHCKYFTRTAQVDHWEKTYRDQILYKQVELPPSPPGTPCSDRSRCSSPANREKRVFEEEEEDDSVLSNMMSTLVV